VSEPLFSGPVEPFGQLKHVPLRELWAHEASGFSAWLASHLPALGGVIGLDLELVSREAPVGPFFLDLLLRDVGTGHTVVVENQIEPTDHDHLGKLLTYAAGFDAAVAVWIAAEFREEHRQALDWLNGRTDQRTSFFGIVVEALRIDDSRPAPNLRLVAFPNDFRKRVVERQSGPTTPRQEAYRAFFQSLVDRLREEYRFTNARKASTDSWVSFGAGVTGVEFSAAFATGGMAHVQLNIERPDTASNSVLFDRLHEQRRAIESELGPGLIWERLDNRRTLRIFEMRPGSITDEPEILAETAEWMVERLLAFKTVLGPRLLQPVTG
jgi:hypothetical protein